MYQRYYEEKAGFYTKAPVGDSSLIKPEKEFENPNLLDREGPKVSCIVAPEPTDDELRFLQQMGVSHCFAWVLMEHSNAPFLKALRCKVESYGLKLYNVGNRLLGKNADIILGTEKRDEEIGKFVAFLHVLAEAGIDTTIFTWEAQGVWTTHESTTRGDTPARAISEDVLAALPLARDRVYTEEELWDNMKYFLDRVLPVAESLNVRLALHPNDPPIPIIAGIPCLIRNKAAYERVFSWFPETKHLGMEFCCGCWLEGGDRFGDLFASLAEFVSRGKVLIVHLRNVSSPLPTFTETYMDGGYGNMYLILRTLVQHGYGGTVILDHTPPFVSAAGLGADTAYSVGFIKAGLLAAQIEKKLLV